VARVSSVGISKHSDNSPSPGKNVKFARTLYIHVCARARTFVCKCMYVYGCNRICITPKGSAYSGKSVLDMSRKRNDTFTYYLYREQKYGGSNNFKKKNRDER